MWYMWKGVGFLVWIQRWFRMVWVDLNWIIVEQPKMTGFIMGRDNGANESIEWNRTNLLAMANLDQLGAYIITSTGLIRGIYWLNLFDGHSGAPFSIGGKLRFFSLMRSWILLSPQCHNFHSPQLCLNVGYPKFHGMSSSHSNWSQVGRGYAQFFQFNWP